MLQLKRFLPIYLLMISGFTYAQELSIEAQVTDAETKDALPGASIRLFHLPDSVQTITTTNEAGLFRITHLKNGSYLLSISYVGYQSLEMPLSLEANTKLGLIRLTPSEAYLSEVEVKEKMLRAEQKGDTTEFNARAYQTQPDANAEDLIRKMPGVVVENGQVQAQGEEVRQVLVDGERFFGNDPAAALKNLPAEIIDKIQVFDQESDQAQFTGFDDGQRTKTINIITRSDKRNGEFGKAYAGYGMDNRYHSGGNINLFKDDQRFSLIGQSNNINIQNFASEDLLGALASGGSVRGGSGRAGGGRRPGMSGRGGGGADASDFMVGQQKGISRTHAAGMNYNDQLSENLKLNASYFFNNSLNTANQQAVRETFLNGDNSLFYDEDQESRTFNTNHRLNFRLEYTLDPATSIILQPALSWQANEGSQSTSAQTFAVQESPLTTNNNLLDTDLNGLNFSNMLLLRRRMAKRGRTLSLRVNTQINRQQGERLLRGSIINEEEQASDLLDQRATLDNYRQTISSNLMYTEPISTGFLWQMNLESTYAKSNADRFTNNFDESFSDYTSIDSALSNEFSSRFQSYAAGTGLRYRVGKFNMMARLQYEIASLKNQQIFPDELQTSRTFHNLLPSAMLQYRLESGKNLRVFYRTATQAPDISDLQGVVDNSNPLQLQLGNPDLKQSYQHSLFARYGSSRAEQGTVFFWLLGGTYTQNFIGSRTLVVSQDSLFQQQLLLPAGGQLIERMNFSQQWTLRSFVSYGVPVEKLKSNLNLNASVNYSNTPSQVNGLQNQNNNLSMGLGVVLSSNISPMIDFTVATRPSFNVVRNNLRQELNSNFFSQRSELRLHARTEGGFFVETETQHQWNAGLADAFNFDFWLVNLSAGQKLFRNQLGEIKLSIFDLLNQNNSIERMVGENFVEDVRTQILQRYAMLTFTYQFRNFRL